MRNKREPKYNEDKDFSLLNYTNKFKDTYKNSRKKLSDIAKQNKLQIKLDAMIEKFQLKIERIKNKRK